MPKLAKEKLEKFRNGELQLAQVFDLNAEQVAALLRIGYTLYAEGRLEDAQKVFEGLSILDGRNPYIHGILGAIYQKQQRYQEAVGRYSRALSLYPQDLNSLTNRGEIYLKMGKFKEAATDLKAAIELDPQGKHPAGSRALMLITLTQQGLKLVKEKGLEASKG